MTAIRDISYGRRLIPQIIDQIAAEEPDRLVYSIFDDTNHRLERISAAQFVRAIDKTASWLHKQVGTQSIIRPLAYIGPHDLRYVLLSYAASKAGCTALFLSPKNNVDGALAVLEAAHCSIWVQAIDQQQSALSQNVLAVRSMNVLELPTVSELLDAADTKPFPYVPRFGDIATQPFCMLHTSGTTGTPKPISWTHALIGTMDAVRLLPRVDGDHGLLPWTSIWDKGDTIYSAFPMSHGAGIIMDILMPALFELHCVLGPAKALPNMNLIDSLADHANIDIWSMVPSLVDELGETPDVLAKFRSTKFICASGGPVSPEIVTKVNDVVRVLNLTGTTEGLFTGNLIVDRKDWHWFAFHPYSGFEFKQIEPGVFEHWVHRDEKHWQLFQGIFHTFPEKDSVNLKDLYIQHPTKSNLWAFKGRSDDVVVLSNGYKISPLSTEAYISSHTAVEGCLVIGTGKTQAGLLVELKHDVVRNNDLFDSIWATVEKSNSLSATKSRLLRNYIAFAKPDQPFIRTDKGTIKRHATLVLYTEFIDRFYLTRDDEPTLVDIDSASVETIVKSLRNILSEAMPGIVHASPDDDLFDLGLDSLLVFQTVNAIKIAMNLKDKLSPRHLYANPTLSTFATLLVRLKETSKSGESNADKLGGPLPVVTQLDRLIAQHKARQSFKLNPFDYVNANHYMGLNLYFPLQENTTFDAAFSKLQVGLHRTLEMIPTLAGQIMPCSKDELGYRQGDLRLIMPPVSPLSSPNIFTPPRQLIFKDLSSSLPSFEQLRKHSFLPSLVPDALVLPDNPFPAYPADILVAQANFVEGGCILAADFHHGCHDAAGVMVALRAWAENCRFLDGDASATCEWLDPESFNHSLPEILHDLDERRKSIEEIDPGVWGFLPFVHPERLQKGMNGHASTLKRRSGSVHAANVASDSDQEARSLEGSALKKLPAPPKWKHILGWPPAPDSAGRALRTVMFLIPAGKLQELKSMVQADPLTGDSVSSISDIIQALFWRVAIRTRYRVATEAYGIVVDDTEDAILELPIDSRPHFSPLLPATYMGSMLILNRVTTSVRFLISPDTTIGQIAQVMRRAAARITPSLVSDAFTILRSLPCYDPTGQFSLADMGLDGMHAMISNMILFQPQDISFGSGFFADNGVPAALRPQIERGRSRFRFLVIFPMRSDGGVELVLGTLPEELELLKKDPELGKYATLVDPKE